MRFRLLLDLLMGSSIRLKEGLGVMDERRKSCSSSEVRSRGSSTCTVICDVISLYFFSFLTSTALLPLLSRQSKNRIFISSVHLRYLFRCWSGKYLVHFESYKNITLLVRLALPNEQSWGVSRPPIIMDLQATCPNPSLALSNTLTITSIKHQTNNSS